MQRMFFRPINDNDSTEIKTGLRAFHSGLENPSTVEPVVNATVIRFMVNANTCLPGDVTNIHKGKNQLPKYSLEEVVAHAKVAHAKVAHAKVAHAKVAHAKVAQAKVDHAKVAHAKVDHAKVDHAKVDHAKVAQAKVDHAKVDHAK